MQLQQHRPSVRFSSQLATTGCMGAGTAYDIDLPTDKVPTARLPGAMGVPQWAVCTTTAGVPQPVDCSRSFPQIFQETFWRAIMPVIPSLWQTARDLHNRSIESTTKVVLRKRRTTKHSTLTLK